jgi:epoxyqueuosine reductase
MQEKILKNSSENSSEDRSTPDFSQLAEIIKIWGKELGFQEVRIADPDADMAQSERGLQQWLNEGYHGEMDYMAKHGVRRTHPAERSWHAEGDFRTHELYASSEG